MKNLPFLRKLITNKARMYTDIIPAFLGKIYGIIRQATYV